MWAVFGLKRATFAALADAVVPATPALAGERGEEHRPGGLEADLDDELVAAFDSLQEVHGGPLARLGYDAYPYSLVVAVLLEVVAVELVLRGRAREGLGRRREVPTRTPFSALSRRDRLRAVRLLEADGVLPWLDARFGDRLPHLGFPAYLAQALNTLPQLAYYSEWCADGTPDSPAEVQSWRQTGYSGPADGYRDHRGYEVRAFEEDDW